MFLCDYCDYGASEANDVVIIVAIVVVVVVVVVVLLLLLAPEAYVCIYNIVQKG